ncbi:chorismate--pyruvate lyase family protein [Chondrinema litorale]|uniref:chorismate--pyruvate lyase family protein n=1 Tax=Chondrinema litorale TaxID=2994555 RepID=UPI0025430B4E|nr:chorismate lyase [Chondrinema litorale]UZR96894.1 chorismate lyase [Chondrinema litorale]
MNWRYLQINELNNIPYKELNWLTRPYILSKAIKNVSVSFKVHLLSQGNGNLIPDDLLNSANNSSNNGFIRQVFLCGNDIPWVYARVAIPNETLINHSNFFNDLDTRPIGETFLYNNPKVSRSLFQVKSFTRADEIYQLALCTDGKKIKPEKLWGRRSIFYLEESPFTITEVFLEEIPLYTPITDSLRPSDF